MTEGDIKRIRTRARSEVDTLGEFWAQQIRALCDEVKRLSADLDHLVGTEAKAIKTTRLIRERDGARTTLRQALQILALGLSESPRSDCHCYGWKPCWLHGEAARLMGVVGIVRSIQ